MEENKEVILPLSLLFSKNLQLKDASVCFREESESETPSFSQHNMNKEYEMAKLIKDISIAEVDQL